MNIELKENGLPATKELQHFARCRADHAFGALRDQIGLISLFLERTSDATGESASRCLALIQRTAQPDFKIESTHANPYVALHKTLDDAGWGLAHAVMQQQSEMIHRQVEILDSQFDVADAFSGRAA